MAALTIPISNAESYGAFYFIVDLEGANYEFRFQYNARESRWYLGIYRSGSPIRQGIKCVINWPLLLRDAELTRPPGHLLVIDSRSVPEDPVLETLGRDGLLTYVEEGTF